MPTRADHIQLNAFQIII